MTDYYLIIVYSPTSFNIHILPESELANLEGHEYSVLLKTNKSHCSYLFKTLQSSTCTVLDEQTSKYYSGDLQKITKIMEQANTDYQRVKLTSIDLTDFNRMWSRLTSHFPEYNQGNELIVNAEESTVVVYTDQSPNQRFVIYTDSPNSPNNYLTMRSVGSNGLITDIQLLTDKDAPQWEVMYEITDSTITCIKTSDINREKLEDAIAKSVAILYKYEFNASLEETINCILSENFEPKWY